MWLYFNRSGQILTTLEHGEMARVGTTKFSIFAVFEGINEDNIGAYDATIKLRKPDLTGSTYPLLLMQTASSTFNKLSGETDTGNFQNGTTYYGFLFNFGDFNSSESDEVLLDTDGLWEAVITLIRGDLNVQGTATFEVAGTGTETSTVISYDIITNQLLQAINERALKTNVVFRMSYNASGKTVSDLWSALNDNEQANNVVCVRLSGTDNNGDYIVFVNRSLDATTQEYLYYFEFERYSSSFRATLLYSV